MFKKFPYEGEAVWLPTQELLEEGRRKCPKAILLDVERETEIRKRIGIAKISLQEPDWNEFDANALPGLYGSTYEHDHEFVGEEFVRVAHLYGALGLDRVGMFGAIDAMRIIREEESGDDWKTPFWLARSILDLQVRLVTSDKEPVHSLDTAKAQSPEHFFPAVVFFWDWCMAMMCVDGEDGEYWDIWHAFEGAWEGMRTTPSQNALARAYGSALKEPINLLFKTGPAGEALAKVASVAYYLQRERVGNTIQLPVQELGKRLYPKQRQPAHNAGRLIKLLTAANLLTCDDPSFSYTQKKAREFRFNLNRTDLYSLPTK